MQSRVIADECEERMVHHIKYIESRRAGRIVWRVTNFQESILCDNHNKLINDSEISLGRRFKKGSELQNSRKHWLTFLHKTTDVSDQAQSATSAQTASSKDKHNGTSTAISMPDGKKEAQTSEHDSQPHAQLTVESMAVDCDSSPKASVYIRSHVTRTLQQFLRNGCSSRTRSFLWF
eukprot:761837-Hanusia_phi.AAC.5